MLRRKSYDVYHNNYIQRYVFSLKCIYILCLLDRKKIFRFIIFQILDIFKYQIWIYLRNLLTKSSSFYNNILNFLLKYQYLIICIWFVLFFLKLIQKNFNKYASSLVVVPVNQRRNRESFLFFHNSTTLFFFRKWSMLVDTVLVTRIMY